MKALLPFMVSSINMWIQTLLHTHVPDFCKKPSLNFEGQIQISLSAQVKVISLLLTGQMYLW